MSERVARASVIIREMGPGDVGPASVLHASAFPDFFLTGLGEPFLRQFYKGFLGDPTAITTVAVDHHGELVGVAVGSTRPQGFFRRLVRRQLFGFAWASVRAVIANPTCAPRLARGARYRGGRGAGEACALLSSIFVSPDASGHGAGARLLEAWCSRASDLGSVKARLLTDAVGNERVNDFYVRCGWTLEGQQVTPEGRLMNAYAKHLGDS